MAQIPGTLETLKARKQHYLDERAKVGISETPTTCFAPCPWRQGLSEPSWHAFDAAARRHRVPKGAEIKTCL